MCSRKTLLHIYSLLMQINLIIQNLEILNSVANLVVDLRKELSD